MGGKIQGDGIPDWWRLGYFGHATGLAADSSRAADDADGDHMSNLNEFFAATDPLNAASVFRITQITTAAGDVQVSFDTAQNRAYQLQRRDSLEVSSAWMDIGASVAGNGATMVVMDGGGATNSARYYRVQAH